MGYSLVNKCRLAPSSAQSGDCRRVSQIPDVFFEEEDTNTRRRIIYPPHIQIPARKPPVLLHVPYHICPGVVGKLPCFQIGIQKETELLVCLYFLYPEVRW